MGNYCASAREKFGDKYEEQKGQFGEIQKKMKNSMNEKYASAKDQYNSAKAKA